MAVGLQLLLHGVGKRIRIILQRIGHPLVQAFRKVLHLVHRLGDEEVNTEHHTEKADQETGKPDEFSGSVIRKSQDRKDYAEDGSYQAEDAENDDEYSV